MTRAFRSVRVDMLVLVLAACGGREHVVAATGVAATGTDGGGVASSTTVSDGPETSDEKLDVLGNDPGGACEGLGALDFSYIWIANSDIGQVSKIDTLTAEELARYRTGPAEPNPDPSRTAVNLRGDVAVINRRPNPAGVVKIAARREDCVDRNGNGAIDTSEGPADVRAWGQDECILWHSEAQDYVADPEGGNVWGPRPAAWDGGAGELDPDGGCPEDGGRLWVGWYTGATAQNNAGRFQRLDGSTGAVLDDVVVPEWSLDPQIRSTPYGAAATRAGDLWVVGRFSELALIDGGTLEVRLWRQPGADFYGMALDADGQPWIAGWDGSLYTFDRDTETFVVEATPGGRLRGIAIDSRGSAWIATHAAVVAEGCWLAHYDTAEHTMLDARVPIVGCRSPVGVAIDAEDFVWVVDVNADAAFKVDPLDYTNVATVHGLVEPYTYSDMTGSGLKVVVGPG